MNIETLLERYPADVATLKLLSKTMQDHEEIIINSSNAGSGERVQSSGVSDITADKAMQLVELKEIMLQRHKDLTKRIKAIEAGLDQLSPIELQVVTLRYFEYKGIYEVGDILDMHIRTVYRHLESAKSKMITDLRRFL